MYVYINGAVVPREEAQLSAFDHGFLYGLGLFETFRTYSGHPFLLDDHLARLNKGLSERSHRKAVRPRRSGGDHRAVARGQWLARRVMCAFNVSAGVGDLGLPIERYRNPTVIVYMKPLPPTRTLRNGKERGGARGKAKQPGRQ